MGRFISEGLTDAVRRFQWFYTCHVGAPHELAEHSAMSLTELRVLFAIRHANTCTAADISRKLGLDTGYLSRMLMQFERSGLIARHQQAGDARSSHLSLETAGETALAATSAYVRDDVSTVLQAMTPDEGSQLIASMGLVERLLSSSRDTTQVHLRGPRPGDFGWIVEREAQLITSGIQAQSERETLVAMLVGDYLTAPDPMRNACRIAEQDGANVGASVLMRSAESAGSACIAVLFVERRARRQGIALQLIETCVAFAAESGYEHIVCTPETDAEFIAPLLLRFGFEKQEDEPGWEKWLT
jgi:DNA-binding MarR family transcriptional regulator/GNAT superfamily N-acetyltransferase